MLGMISDWNMRKVGTGFTAREFRGRKDCP